MKIFSTFLVAAISATAQHSISAPASVKAGAPFEVTVSGKLGGGDSVCLVAKSHPMNNRGANYGYFHKPPLAKLTAPEKPGQDYELRLHVGPAPFKVLARRPIVVEGVTATLEAPETVAAGAAFPVNWSGPANSGDTITIAEPAAPSGKRVAYAYTGRKPATLTAPDRPGEYELRYVTARASFVLAARRIVVGGVAAAVEAPAEIAAGAILEVRWKGPNNAGDVINVVRTGAARRSAWGYPGTGNPARFAAPLEPGAYEVRYQTGQSRAILARAPLKVVPATEQPGKLMVVRSGSGIGVDLKGSTVEIILDASGSMLQRLGSKRRIDIATETLTGLTSKVIPQGTPFILRVFGKEVGSCQTDLAVPLAPLDRVKVAARIASLQAKNNAKTPIGASLAAVRADVKGARGDLVVVLITDGEETCGGDPAGAIAALRASGIGVTVNIVGFAIDDEGLKETFQEWAGLGGGGYFNARDAAGLESALTGALRESFQVTDAAGGTVATGVVGGDAVTLAPGAYTVRTRSGTAPARIQAGLTATVTVR